jgi:hypothetical protein
MREPIIDEQFAAAEQEHDLRIIAALEEAILLHDWHSAADRWAQLAHLHEALISACIRAHVVTRSGAQTTRGPCGVEALSSDDHPSARPL